MKANFSAQHSLPRNMVYFAKEEMVLGRTGYVGAICVLVSLPFHLAPQIKICALYGCSESCVVKFCSSKFTKEDGPFCVVGIVTRRRTGRPKNRSSISRVVGDVYFPRCFRTWGPAILLSKVYLKSPLWALRQQLTPIKCRG